MFRVIGVHSLRISSSGFKHLNFLFHPKNSNCFMTFNERRNFDGCGKPLDFQRMYCGKPSLGLRGVELGRSIF